MRPELAGALIRRARLEKNWSQEGLCRGICSVSWLSKIEAGREGADPELFCREHGLFLEKVGEGDLSAAVAKVLAENADAVEKYRAGSDKVFGFLVGRCMAALRGKADPASVNRALREALKR